MVFEAQGTDGIAVEARIVYNGKPEESSRVFKRVKK
jgi:hypothetical protein